MWKQSYNACPTVLYSIIDIGSVSVFTVQIDDTSENKPLLLTHEMGRNFTKVGARSYWAPSNKKVRGPSPSHPNSSDAYESNVTEFNVRPCCDCDCHSDIVTKTTVATTTVASSSVSIGELSFLQSSKLEPIDLQ